MLFFSFSVAWGSEAGLGGGGGQRERDTEFGLIWVPGKLYALFSHLTGVDSGNCLLSPQVDMNIVRAQSTERSFFFFLDALRAKLLRLGVGLGNKGPLTSSQGLAHAAPPLGFGCLLCGVPATYCLMT